jgi:TDG/mug DNA glycosylase family protein
MSGSPRPGKAELAAAAGRTVADLLAPNLRVLFCGINPGLYSGVTGHHFARPGNRFWRTLHLAGFTPRQLRPDEEQELLAYGYGITNLVARATATAAELSPAELAEGAQQLRSKVERYQPHRLAILGISAYRLAFARPAATPGPQAEDLAGAQVFVLPNPSGLNAHYTPADLVRVFGAFREALDARE